MEKTARRRLLDAAYALLAAEGAKGASVRRVEEQAELPHGSVRHHFGSREGLVSSLVRDLIDDDLAHFPEQPAEMLARMLGPDRERTVARYELFLLAARDDRLREEVVAARESLVALAAAAGLGPEAARAVVAAVDGLVLDGVLRGDAGVDPAVLLALRPPVGG